MSLEFKQKLWEHIVENIRPYRKINNNQLSIRCPFCGDSIKNPNSTHFYIKINMKENEPVLFHCFRCETSGILNPSVLRTLNINSLDINSELIKYNRESLKNSKYSHFMLKDNELNLKVHYPDENDKNNQIKKKYIEDRLGVTFSFKELVKLKTVFSLGQFLKFNNINKITVSKEKALMLHEDYVGFLTSKNEFINFRKVNDKNHIGRRYEKYSIFPSLDNTRKFYTIPNKIDLLTNKNITINIAEGVFDILGIYYHIYEKEMDRMIYAAACGAGFTNVLKYFIKKGIYGKVTINIYSDSDKDFNFYKPLVKELEPWVDKINLFYNKLEKDYGVPKNKINIYRKNI